MRLASYCRVSTLAQKEEQTIDIQLAANEAFATELGHEIIMVFKDEGVSGGLADRPGLAAIFNYLDDNPGTIDAVLIYKLDRLARDLYIQEGLLKELQKRNVALLSVKERDLDSGDPMRVAFRQFMGIVAELEKAFITMRLSAGRLNKASKSRYAGGCVPYGCRTVEKDLVVDLASQEIVEQIFAMRGDGHSTSGTARHLNKVGVPTPKYGKGWYVGAVSYILSNPIYSGQLSYKGNHSRREDLALPNR
jgi:site-specific DNA recombinase